MENGEESDREVQRNPKTGGSQRPHKRREWPSLNGRNYERVKDRRSEPIYASEHTNYSTVERKLKHWTGIACLFIAISVFLTGGVGLLLFQGYNGAILIYLCMYSFKIHEP